MERNQRNSLTPRRSKRIQARPPRRQRRNNPPSSTNPLVLLPPSPPPPPPSRCSPSTELSLAPPLQGIQIPPPPFLHRLTSNTRTIQPQFRPLSSTNLPKTTIFTQPKTIQEIQEIIRSTTSQSSYRSSTPLLWASIETPPTQEKISLMHNTLLQLNNRLPNHQTSPPPLPPKLRWSQDRAHLLHLNPLIPPPHLRNLATLPLAFDPIEKDVELPGNLMILAQTQGEVVGLRVDVNFLETSLTTREIQSTLSPLSMIDIFPTPQAQQWEDRKMALPPIPPTELKEEYLSPPSFPNLNMKVVLWNVRGATRNDFIPHAWDIIATHKPSIFIILEAKSNGVRALEVSRMLGFDGLRFIEPNGSRGGIWLMFNAGVELILYNPKSINFFHALFKFKPHNTEVLLTGIHAPSNPSERHRMWNNLKNDLPPDDTPWLVLGDLNEVTSPTEKMGGRNFRMSQCQDLNMLADAACLVDLGFNGNPYTWHNAREGAAIIRERLDRAMANPSWLNNFPNTQVSNPMIASSSKSSPRVWSPPQRGYYKLNTDASWISLGAAGAGGLIRCQQGKWQIGFSVKISALGPASAELFAIKEGLSTSWARGIRFLELETDAQALKYMLENPLYYIDHELSNFINDIVKLLQREWSVTILHVKRQSNKLAHGLAQIGRLQPDDDVAYQFFSPSAFTKVYMDELAYSLALTKGP
ncbi:uncharacterized protein LOC110730268 isoform X1 [Chenopodium quinoa]|uniref:uncharacterized protein LOC110730268 isoform X1 n=1 Tax=Chenopodium quinoa TaxID=63459 RepID=UPI000B77F05C|nr:uncharacterized protein LOC110730268 isoform X1 [Chenopodium quinoa]